MLKYYLCHKCSGNLGHAHPELHGCRCISGWIRDWQEPVFLIQALEEQEKTAKMWKALKEEQNRAARIAHLYRREHHRKWWQDARPIEDIK